MWIPEGKTETKHKYRDVPYLFPSNVRAACITVLPQFVFCRNHAEWMFCLTSVSLGYPGRGEWENTQVHNLETFPLTASFICRQSPPAAYTSWNKLKCPSSNCSLSNFDPEGGRKFRILGGAIWITKHLYLPFFYGNIIILRNNLLIIREMKNFALQQSWWHSSDMNCKSRYSNSRKRSP